MIRISLLLSFTFVVSSIFGYEITDLKQLKGHEFEVTSIKLINKGLSVFPAEILACPNLVELDLSNNGIIKIPIELGQQSQLKTLNFSGNQGLSYLDLEDLFEKANFQLETLNIKGCEMGFIPHQIGRQKALKNLNVSGNLLNNLPYPVVQLTKLEKVDVSNNRIEDLSWQVHQWWNLKELDVSENRSLKLSELIFSLSVKEGMKKLVISHTLEIPKAFQDLDIEELEIRNSTIGQFPRVETSTPIRKLSFINCTFLRPEKTAEIINDFVKPNYLALNGIKIPELKFFLGVSVDSVNLQNNQLSDIRVLAGHKKLKWIDARGNSINEASLQVLKTYRPDIKIMLSEPVSEMRGINPPIPELAPKPIIKRINADKENIILMGRAMMEIPLNTFVDGQGKIYEGPVDLAYTEYMTTTQVFLSGITMTSDSASENLMFSSGGMFSLTATDKSGNELSMNPTKEIKVDLLSSSANPAMNLYALNDNGVWEYRGKDSINEPFKLDMAKINAAADSAFLNFRRKNIIVTDNRYLPFIKRDGNTKSFTIHFAELVTEKGRNAIFQDKNNFYIKQPTSSRSFLSKNTFVFDGDRDSVKFYYEQLSTMRRNAMKDYRMFSKGSKMIGLSDNYNWGVNYINSLDLRLDRETDRLFLDFKYKEEAHSIPVVLKSNPGNARGRVKTYKQFYKVYNSQRKKDALAKLRRNRQLEIMIKKEEIEVRNLARQREEARQRIYYENRDYLNEIAGESSVSRGFAITGFGVWNCDQRQRMDAPVELPNHFVNEEGERLSDSHDDISIYVIDYDKNGVLRFGTGQQAFYDKSTQKMAIIVFFSAVSVGVYQSWRKLKEGVGMNQSEIPIRKLDITNMNTQSLLEFIEN